VTDSAATTGSGPAIARLYHRLLAAVFLVAWLSLGAQLDVLIGSRGLLPLAPYLAGAGARGLGPAQLPTIFWIDASDTVLRLGIWLGVALAVGALLGVRPRLCTALATFLYLSYVTACRDFLSFQWDNLLLECGLLATFLPTDRPAPWIHVLFRLLLFKLYFESGIAKWQSHLGDWQDGSAMTLYYETAPLPAWHHFESWATLVIELVLPAFIFGPRPVRLLCFAAFTGFQLINLATANYGFFVYLTLMLHVFLLADRDLERLSARLPAPRRPTPPPRPPAPSTRRLRAVGAAAVVAVFIGVSAIDAVNAFVPMPPDWGRLVAPLETLYRPWRVINTYHLFGHITQTRIEPEFEAQVDGAWQPLELRYKPGDPKRAPRLVAPHQPRIDFLLWFYGLSFQRDMPAYVRTLLDRLCSDPTAVQDLFVTPPPAAPDAVRIQFWRYHFSAPDEPVAWWTREPVATTRPLVCEKRET
jgi:hypothetical protein